MLHPYQTRDLCFFGVTHDPKVSRIMAGTTGLEPATSAVTGQHSNQLNYVPAMQLDGLREIRVVIDDCRLRIQCTFRFGMHGMVAISPLPPINRQ